MKVVPCVVNRETSLDSVGLTVVLVAAGVRGRVIKSAVKGSWLGVVGDEAVEESGESDTSLSLRAET